MDSGRYTVDGDKMRHLRSRRILSTQEAAKLAEVSPHTWNQLEQGNRRANSKTLKKIAHVLKVDPQELVIW
jgi:DNA-binding XRE family transcriptional regulator